MMKSGIFLIYLILFLIPLTIKGQENMSLPLKEENNQREDFLSRGPQYAAITQMRLKSNLMPWLLTIPNLGAEFTFGNKWSASADLWYCPWKLSDRFSVKTISIFPEIRWWLKSNVKGSFFNIHLNLAWFNVRANEFRYQDKGRPLLGAGVGYGYRLPLNYRWAFEFEIGAGVINSRYDRFYNVENGALKDTRITTYWGIDRISVVISYFLCDI